MNDNAAEFFKNKPYDWAERLLEMFEQQITPDEWSDLCSMVADGVDFPADYDAIGRMFYYIIVKAADNCQDEINDEHITEEY